MAIYKIQHLEGIVKAHTRVQSEAKSQTLMLLSCSSSWWYWLTLSGCCQSQNTQPSPHLQHREEIVSHRNCCSCCKWWWELDLPELFDLDMCCSGSDHKAISLLRALRGKVRPPLTRGELFDVQFIWYICKHYLHKIKHSRLTNSLLAIEITKDVHPLHPALHLQLKHYQAAKGHEASIMFEA